MAISKLYNDIIEVDNDTGDVTISGALSANGSTVLTGADAATITATAAEIDTNAGVTAGTVTASKTVVVDSNKDIATFGNVTATTFIGALTGTATGLSSLLLQFALATAAKTAGTTQTQAGATAITTTVTLGTTGNADDGYLLPAMTAGKVILIVNLSANAAKIYANGTETLNGTAGNAGSTALGASKTTLIIGTGAGTSVTATFE